MQPRLPLDPVVGPSAPWAVPEDVTVEVDATKASAGLGSFGVGCRHEGGLRYSALIDITRRGGSPASTSRAPSRDGSPRGRRAPSTAAAPTTWRSSADAVRSTVRCSSRFRSTTRRWVQSSTSTDSPTAGSAWSSPRAPKQSPWDSTTSSLVTHSSFRLGFSPLPRGTLVRMKVQRRAALEEPEEDAEVPTPPNSGTHVAPTLPLVTATGASGRCGRRRPRSRPQRRRRPPG
jgi:hypothetical protein